MASDRPVTFADRAVETLRQFEEERERRPAYRAPALDRVLARLIDGGIVFCLVLAAIVADHRLRGEPEDTPMPGATVTGDPSTEDEPPLISWGPGGLAPVGVLVILAAAGVFVLYEVGTTMSMGASPGKRILGVRVVRASDRGSPETWRLILRSTILAVPLAFAVLSGTSSLFYGWLGRGTTIAMFAWIRRDGAQTLYDRWAGTQVISLREEQ
jgi:uncharacterized RDD family membrane protein YckC